MSDLTRFTKAQQKDYCIALEEVRNGKKKNHWIWYIFPQLKLGRSQTSLYYGLNGLEEAREYLADPVLGPRLLEITKALAELPEYDAEKIFGYPDCLKVRSCMTLFICADPDEPLFKLVLDKFYDGKLDEKTLELIEKGT